MSVKLKEYQAHVVKDLNDPLGRSWCGVVTSGTFALLGEDHAKGCVEKETRVQPCPKCWSAIQETSA